MVTIKLFSRFALTCTVAFALGAATLMTSCDDGGEEPTAQGITITIQPTAPAGLVEGAIPANTKLTVVATVTGGAILTYQWYTNTTASNEGGATISGDTSASYTLPTDLTEGTYYYFCEVGAEGATAVRTNVVTVTVNAVPLVAQNSRITWRDGKYALTTDPTDAGLLFKFGSVVGLFTGNGVVLTLPSTNGDDFDPGDIAWNPTGATTWEDIPVYQATDYPADVDAAYHTASNVKAGKGDPCRLVGLDLNKIKNIADTSLTPADIDNGQWRLPTNAENKSFTGYTDYYTETTAHWTTLSHVKGGMFPNVTDGSAATFLPAVGIRTVYFGTFIAVGNSGYYWSDAPYSTITGYYIHFYAAGVYPSTYSGGHEYGYAVRCVRQ